jgi:hypothetical protein
MNMKLKITLFIYVASLLYGMNMKAQTSIATGVDFSSADIFHGMTFNKGMVAQPYLSITGKRFAYLFWGNYSLQSNDNSFGHLSANKFSEMDHLFTYLLPVKTLNLDITLGVYTYPELNWHLKELQFGGQKSLHSLLVLYARAGYMFSGDLNKNLYIEFGSKGGYPLLENLSFNYQLKVAWERQGFIPSVPVGMKDLLGNAGVTWMIQKDAGITAKIYYVGQLNDKILTNEAYDVKWYASAGFFTAF